MATEAYQNFLDKNGKIKTPGGAKLRGVYHYHELRSIIKCEGVRVYLDHVTDRALSMGMKMVVSKKRLSYRFATNVLVIEPRKSCFHVFKRTLEQKEERLTVRSEEQINKVFEDIDNNSGSILL